MHKIAVVIVAAGRGTRFGNHCPKQYHVLGGQAILARTLSQFLTHPDINDIVTVIHPNDQTLYQQVNLTLAHTDVTDLHQAVNGGKTRQESAFNGLAYLAGLPSDQQPDLVLIHDAARPLISHEAIDRLIEHLNNTQAVITAVPVADTLKRADPSAHTPVIGDTLDHQGVWRAQTPQGFDFKMIWSAHQTAKQQNRSDYTDDAAVAEAFGQKVHLVMGDEQNFKITTKHDIIRAHQLLDHQSTSMPIKTEPRIGKGFDVHRLGPGTEITLCGLNLPHDQTMIGHSDADVGLHALVDALLGAIGMGDIGQHFPPTEEQWKNANSGKFVSYAVSLISARGARIINVDVTLMCERPKILTYRYQMRQTIADLLDISIDRVNIKATTTEKLGFTGRGEGIAAEAVALVSVPTLFKRVF